MAKRIAVITLFIILLVVAGVDGYSQCSVCTRTAQQLGEGPAKGLNAGILYLAAVPFSIIGYLYYRWKKGR